jgi:glycopeptide antibiotics resistance protein
LGQWWRSFQSFLPFALGLVVLWIVVGIAWGRLDLRRRNQVALLLFATWMFALACLTLFPQGERLDAHNHETYHILQLRPFADIAADTVHAVTWRVGVEQVGGNVALFVPLGILAYLLVELRRLPIWAALALGPLFGCAIELVQRILPLGRATTTDDVILASAGSLLGLGLGWLFRHPARRSQAVPPRLRTSNWTARSSDG